MLLLDIDEFKKYNDSRGHLAGDDCLQTSPNDSISGRPAGRFRGALRRRRIRRHSLRNRSHRCFALANVVAEKFRHRQLMHPTSSVGPFITMNMAAQPWSPRQASLQPNSSERPATRPFIKEIGGTEPDRADRLASAAVLRRTADTFQSV